MAYQSLDLGTSADDGTGDSLRVGGDKINDNFSEIYTLLGTGTALTSGLSATATVVTLSSAVGTFTTLTPAAADGTALGSASLEFSDLFLADGAIINLGSDQDVTLTHVADTGILLNSTRQLQFGDSGTYIHQSADGVLDLVSDTEIEINATTIDINGNVDVSGTYTGAGLMTTGGNIVIPNAGNIGSVSDTNAITISSGGVVAVTATTANTSASDGALTVAGGLGVAADVSIGDDLRLISDAAVLSFGADSEVTLTHVHDDGLLLNSTNKLMFNDASQFIQGASATVLDIAATDEIELTATLIDVVGNLAGSGTGTFGGILKTDDTTEATSTTDGSLQTDGGLSVAKDIVAGNDVKLLSDAAVLAFGADGDVTLTHVADTGILLNSTMAIQFNDASQSINAPSNAILDINATDEIELNATLLDVNANINASGTYTGAGLMTTGGNIVIPDAGNIGSASDTNAIAIGSDGDVTLTQDLELQHDGAILSFGANDDVTVTHVHDTGIALNSKDIAGVTSINAGHIGGRRNILYNGEMKVAQRSASVTGLGAASGYFTLDRWNMLEPTSNGHTAQAGRYTMAQVADGPAGFANCLKLTCTTADTSIAANEVLFLNQRLEGQDLQHLKKGTGSAEQITVSFYVKGNASATYVLELLDLDNNRHNTQSFAVTTDWNRIELTFAADTTGALDDDTAVSLFVNFWLHGGSTYTGGTFASNTWASLTNANRLGSGKTSFFDSTDRTFFITGVQMEIGATATEFESRSYGEELRMCERYCSVYASASSFVMPVRQAQVDSANRPEYILHYPTKRAAPSIAVTDPTNFKVLTAANTGIAVASFSGTLVGTGLNGSNLFFTVSSGVSTNDLSGICLELIVFQNTGVITVNAEL